MMVKFGRTNHLSHPLCETLLRQKWMSYGFPIYMLNVVFYVLFLAMYSYFIVSYPACNHRDSWLSSASSPSRSSVSPSSTSSSSSSSCGDGDYRPFKESASVMQVMCVWYLLLYCMVNMAMEVMQLVQDGWEYWCDVENYMQWMLYVSTVSFGLPFVFNVSTHYQWIAGALGICSVYFVLLLLLGRLYSYGIYVIMFLEILKTLLHVLSLFSILIIGFAMTFCIIRPFGQVCRWDSSMGNVLLIFS
jgi:transient receptor potential cation channel subfamily A member 1